MKAAQPKIVVIGGGTGSFTLLQALKLRTKNLTALVNMADDGGSTGTLRDELGVLPPGDVRQCLVALSQAPAELRDLFNFRFDEGGLKGHSFGNLFLSAVEKMTDDFSEAIRIAGDVLRITGQVLPITLDDSRLTLTIGHKTIIGQHKIEAMHLPQGVKPNLSLAPPGRLSPPAKRAIAEADLVVIAPGNLYASLAPALLVEGLADSLDVSPAPLVYIANLVNKPNHTANFAVHNYASEIERIIAPAKLDYVLYNTVRPTDWQLRAYALEGEHPVSVNVAALKAADYTALGGKFLASQAAIEAADSPISHTLLRHDATAIADTLLSLT